MVRVDGEPIVNRDTKEAKYSFFADTKDEVVDNMTQANTKGLLAGLEIQQGSTMITAEGDFAFRKSDGSWNWLGDE